MKPCRPKESAAAFMVSTESATTPLVKYVSYIGNNKKAMLHQQIQVIITTRDIKLREESEFHVEIILSPQCDCKSVSE